MAYILGGARTPYGAFLGHFAQTPVSTLGAVAIDGAIKRAGIEAQCVHEIFMGHVIQAGTGQAPARQAALGAKLPESVPCTTVNKVCGSGIQSIILGHQSIETKENELVIAGGMENMSMAPYLSIGHRQGTRFGDSILRDSMQWDGLWDVYSNRSMGACAEECAKKYQISREEQDLFAIESFKRAQRAMKKGLFSSEIAAVELRDSRGQTKMITEDEGPGKANFTKMAKLRPVFAKDGTITAANASSINDGAAAVVLAGEKYSKQAKFKILSHAKHAQNPTWFTTAPMEAMGKLFAQTNLTAKEVDLYEINEAFALVVLAAMKEFDLPHSKVNVHGGAIALGHPIGSSGARIVLSLMTALERQSKKLGVASICIGGGEAIALLIERV